MAQHCPTKITAHGLHDIQVFSPALEEDIEGGCLMLCYGPHYTFVHFPDRWSPMYRVSCGTDGIYIKTNDFGTALDGAVGRLRADVDAWQNKQV